MHSDVLVVGGGPAGVSAAIAARLKGLSVTLVDSRKPPIDKPCGEGLLPEAVSALRRLGVEPSEAPSFRFSGISFQDESSFVAAQLAGASAYGMRRTVLHGLLVKRAQAVGVSLIWGAHLTKQDSMSAEVGGVRIFFRWLVAADGINSTVRRRMGLDPRWRRRLRARFAFRRHYAVAPWADVVEVHWGRDCQMIVTPTSRDEICLALFTSEHRLRIGDALAQFPEVARRIRGARATSAESGTRTAVARSRFVVHGNVALIGDAGCSIDGIAGQGLSLAFQSAIHLADSLTREDLTGYATRHREITRMPVRMTRLMLLMARYPWIRKRTLRMLAARPATFSNMMAIHAGALGGESFSLQRLFGLGWGVLRA